MNKRALLILAEGFEEIEALTCADILRRAKVDTVLAGLNKKIIKGAHEIAVETDILLREAGADYDALVLPGGQPGADNLASSERVISLVKDFNSRSKLIAAICASPAVVLTAAGVTGGVKATCYPGLENRFPRETEYVPGKSVTDSNIITSPGPAYAMEFALKIVLNLMGKDSKEKLAKALLYKNKC